MNLIRKILSYPRSFVAMPLGLLWTLLWSLYTITLFRLEPNRKSGDRIVTIWSSGLLALFNISVDVFGRENIPDEPCLFIFNHSSHFDIPIIFETLPHKSVRFGAKSELFSVPFFGSAMSSLGILKIHRSNRDQVLELYRQSLKRMDEGFSYILAPEGTRQLGFELGDFKSGPFIMGISGQCKIVPIVINGAHKILPKYSYFPALGRWTSMVKVHILPALDCKGHGLDQRPELQNMAREKMLQVFDSL